MKEIIEKLRSIDVDKITNNELELLLPSLGMNDEKLTQMRGYMHHHSVIYSDIENNII